ncbi:MAG: type II toxin-antitoxin system Phd/YefM family antitoxin [Gemmatimonadales bacterium]
MPRLRLAQDIRPLTEFRANSAAVIAQVQTTKRPVILTQHGRSAAVLLNVGAYESLLDELALLRDVQAAEEQVAAGRTTPHDAVARRLRAHIGT